MAIEILQPKAEAWKPVEILKDVMVGGEHRTPGTRLKVPAADAFDLVAAGQAKHLSTSDLKAK
jgi:hypothetical protein